MNELRRYVVLPASGFRSQVLANHPKLRAVAKTVPLAARPSALRAAAPAGQPDPSVTMRVLASTHDDGPKLVEMSSQAELNLIAEIPGIKVVPVVTYEKLRFRHEVEKPAGDRQAARPGGAGIRLRVVDTATGAGVAGAKVVAFTNFATKEGAEAETDGTGLAEVAMTPGTSFDRLYVYGPAKYWGHYADRQATTAEMTVGIQPISLTTDPLLLRRFRQALPERAGQGIKVGIVDTGIAQHHPALPNVSGGANMVYDEIHADPAAATKWGPATIEGEHGTHVAGIVGACPTADMALMGIAPGVELRSYRVFPDQGGPATNYDIMNAIDTAVADGCHIINLSLGGGSPDDGVRAAVGSALAAGTLVIAAAGNDTRQPVSFPASLPSCIAVSAMGTTDTFPQHSVEEGDIAPPRGTNGNEGDFLAAFSNYGPEIAFTGPGVGIVSTLPDATYGAMSGTSMACPTVVGFAAYLLATNPGIMAPAADRPALLKNLLCNSAKGIGFGRDYEGFGLPGI
jgi:subtilisin